MNGTLSKISINDLAERISHLPVNRVVYIYGQEDITAGETYGLMVTDAFETRMYLLCYLGHTHCKAVSCDSGMEHAEEVSAIQDMLASAWTEASLTDFYVDETQWTERAADITPVLATFIRTHRDGFKVSNFTDTFVVEVPTSVIDGDNGRLDATKEFIMQQMRKFAWNILIGRFGNKDVVQVDVFDTLKALGQHLGAFTGLEKPGVRVVPVTVPVPALELQTLLDEELDRWDTETILTTDEEDIELHRLFLETLQRLTHIVAVREEKAQEEASKVFKSWKGEK